MDIAKVKVSGVKAQTIWCETIPAGIIGATVTFEYTDPMWDNLTKTVVFRGCYTKDIINAGDSVEIPAEVVAKPGVRLTVGKITMSFTVNCNYLSHDSLMNIINALEPTSTAKTLTIGSTNLKKLTEVEIAVATEKGWSIL